MSPTSAQREQLVLQHIPSIGALIHQVQLGDDPNGALTWRVTTGGLSRLLLPPLQIPRIPKHPHNDLILGHSLAHSAAPLS